LPVPADNFNTKKNIEIFKTDDNIEDYFIWDTYTIEELVFVYFMDDTTFTWRNSIKIYLEELNYDVSRLNL
jgi:hypothetical protein